MITSWNLICEKCNKSFSTAYPESDHCPHCGSEAAFSVVHTKDINLSTITSMSFNQAFDVVVREFEKNKLARETYETLMSLSIVYTFQLNSLNFCRLDEVADEAAKNFLDSLIKREKK